MSSTATKIHDFAIKGATCAPCTPYKENGDLNLEMIKPYIDHLLEYGIENVFVNGTVGEGNNMTVEERTLVAEAWLTHGRDKLSSVIIQVGAGNLRASQFLARHAEAIGADAIACVITTYYKPETLEDYVAYMEAVAKAAPITPFYLYDIDFVTGLSFSTVDFFDMAIPRIPTLRGVKHTTPSLSNMHQLTFKHRDKIQVLLANDELYLEALVLGIENNVGFSFLGPALKRIKEAFDSGDFEKARMEQAHVIELLSIRRKHGMSFPGFVKAVMSALGLPMGPPRLPLSPIGKLTESVKTELTNLGFFERGTSTEQHTHSRPHSHSPTPTATPTATPTPTQTRLATQPVTHPPITQPLSHTTTHERPAK